jgi:heme/copper-type cytochrome/quinol oxidase subunit 4
MTKKYGCSRWVNALGALGYLSLFVQWLWSIIMIGYPSLEDGSLTHFLQPSSTSDAIRLPDMVIPMAVALPFTIIVTVVVVVATLIAFFSLPRTIGKGGATVTHKAAKVSTDYAARHHHIKKSEKKRLDTRIIALLKITLSFVAFILVILPHPATPLEYRLVVLVGALEFAATLIYFAGQYLVARIRQVDPTTVW